MFGGDVHVNPQVEFVLPVQRLEQTKGLAAFTLHPLVLLYVASGSAMISATLRIPKP
jgi:hypothetical protein